MSAHRKQHGLTSVADHAPGTNNTVAATITGAVAEQSFGTTAVASSLVQRDAGAEIVVPLTPTGPDRATSRSYVDAAIVTGKTSKELLLTQNQLLSGPTGAVLQGMLATIVNNLVATDTFILTDGTITEIFTAVAGAPAAFQFQIAGSAALTLTNLVAAINNDSTLWSAVETDGLDDYFSGANDPQFVVHRTAFSSNADRVYGILGTQTDIQVVEFATGDQDYRETSGTQSTLPAADPASKRFGFTRTFSGIQTGDTHHIATDNTTFSWDGDDNLWQQTSTGSATSEGDGIDVTGGKVTTDVATATVARKYGGLTNRALSDGSALGASPNAGFNAVITDDVDVAIDGNNAIGIKPASRLDRLKGQKSWADAVNDEPTLTELNAGLGTAAGDITNFAIFVGSTNSKSFWVVKIANTNALTDYVGVEMEDFA